nr:GntR family transcriptional regulator [Pseudomonas sp.]
MRDSGEPPLFMKVADVLRQRLRDNSYPVGIPLPGERELAKEFGVARVTIRSALTRLQEEGVVTRLRGQGTLPVDRTSEAPHSKIRGGLLESIVSFGHRTHTRLASVEWLQAPDTVCQALQIAPGSRVMRVVRVRKARHTPLQCTEVFLPESAGKLVEPHLWEDNPLLSCLERAGYVFQEGEQELTAVNASAAVARMLEIQEGAPVLRINRVVFDGKGVPIQFLIGHYAPERYRYRMRLSRTGGGTRVWIADQQ